VWLGVPKIGVVSERYNLLQVGDLQSWDANASAYPQLNLIEHQKPMWRWKVKEFESKRKTVSEQARAKPLNLRRQAS
jgi:hypothetical protein